MTLEQIREDLRNIRYYFCRKSIFDEADATVEKNDILKIVCKYNSAIKSASPKMYDIYVSLYIKNYTQERLSCELNFTPEYIQKLNKSLLLFFQKSLSQ